MSLPINPKALTMREPFSTLFPIEDEVLEAVTQNMRERGYDPERPVVCWRVDGDRVVIDGHTRARGALDANLEEIRIVVRDFASERDALEFAIAEQRDRRNLTKQQLNGFQARAIAAVDRREQGKRPGTSAPNGTDLPAHGQPTGTAVGAKRTAEIVGTNRMQVKRVRSVLDSGDEEIKAELLGGKTTIRAAADKVAEQRKAAQPKTVTDPEADERHSRRVLTEAVVGAVDRLQLRAGEDEVASDLSRLVPEMLDERWTTERVRRAHDYLGQLLHLMEEAERRNEERIP